MADWKTQRDNLVAAMVRAEGGPDAFVRAVRISIPTCKDFAEAQDIAVTTINHALWDYAGIGSINSFIAFLGRRWAPTNVANDPTHLNNNWISNVISIYQQLTMKG